QEGHALAHVVPRSKRLPASRPAPAAPPLRSRLAFSWPAAILLDDSAHLKGVGSHPPCSALPASQAQPTGICCHGEGKESLPCPCSVSACGRAVCWCCWLRPLPPRPARSPGPSVG